MSDKSLATLHVLVTRPLPQQRELVAAIEAASGHVLHLPLISIKPCTELSNNAALVSLFQKLDNYQILIFVSTNAVQHGMHWIDKYWPQFPIGVELVAIGPATARDLQTALGREVIHSPAGMTSEDLLELPVFAAVKNKRIGIVRGRGGRELLAQSLREKGATVEYLEVYERQVIAYAATDFVTGLKANSINVLTVSSGESLQQLAHVLGDNKAEMSLLPLLVPSRRVADQARELGFSLVINSGGADVNSYITALQRLAGQDPA